MLLFAYVLLSIFRHRNLHKYTNNVEYLIRSVVLYSFYLGDNVCGENIRRLNINYSSFINGNIVITNVLFTQFSAGILSFDTLPATRFLFTFSIGPTKVYVKSFCLCTLSYYVPLRKCYRDTQASKRVLSITRERDRLLTETGRCWRIPTPHPIRYSPYNIFVDHGSAANEHATVCTQLADSGVNGLAIADTSFGLRETVPFSRGTEGTSKLFGRPIFFRLSNNLFPPRSNRTTHTTLVPPLYMPSAPSRVVLLS